MDLSSILKKTEKKNTSIKRNKSSTSHAKINIAEKDRPYDLQEIQKNNLKNSKATPQKKVAT